MCCAHVFFCNAIDESLFIDGHLVSQYIECQDADLFLFHKNILFKLFFWVSNWHWQVNTSLNVGPRCMFWCLVLKACFFVGNFHSAMPGLRSRRLNWVYFVAARMFWAGISHENNQISKLESVELTLAQIHDNFNKRIVWLNCSHPERVVLHFEDNKTIIIIRI